MSSPETSAGFSDELLDLPVPTSTRQVMLVLCVHLLALGSLIAVYHAFAALSLALGLALLVSLRHGLAVSRRLDRGAVTHIRFYRGDWRLLLVDGDWVPARLMKPAFIGRAFIVLVFRSTGAHHTVVLARDALQYDDFRRARVFFRFAGRELTSRTVEA